MIYIYYFFAVIFSIYVLVDFRKKSNDTYFNRYYNSKYYRLLILTIVAIILFILSILRKLFL